MLSDRWAYWNVRLAPIRLGWEPIEVQLRRVRGTMVVGSVLFGLIGSIIGGIFIGFGAVGLGLMFLIGIGVIPALSRWAIYFRLRRRVAEYLRESSSTLNNNDAPLI